MSTSETEESTGLESHLVVLLDRLDPMAPDLLAAAGTAEFRSEFFCLWRSATGHGGPEIGPSTLARIAALGASLGIDFYG